MNVLLEIVNYVRGKESVFIQTHNFPDHDSVASAFGLQHLLTHLGVETHIIYEGEIQRDSLKKMIEMLNIDIKKNTEYPLKDDDMIILVDGCKGNKNVTDLTGEEIAAIDHHETTCSEDVPFVDIRPEYGACSTLIFEYLEGFKVKISRDVATALMIGINMDTALLTRGVSAHDVDAYAALYTIADIAMQNSILRNYIQTRDLDFYRYAINNVKIQEGISFCYFEKGCNQNLLGILGDFFLALEEVDFVINCAKNGPVINFSLRSEVPQWNASLIIQEALKGIGFGGGHADMAGGVIKDISKFNEKEIFNKFHGTLIASQGG